LTASRDRTVPFPSVSPAWRAAHRRAYPVAVSLWLCRSEWVALAVCVGGWYPCVFDPSRRSPRRACVHVCVCGSMCSKVVLHFAVGARGNGCRGSVMQLDDGGSDGMHWGGLKNVSSVLCWPLCVHCCASVAVTVSGRCVRRCSIWTVTACPQACCLAPAEASSCRRLTTPAGLSWAAQAART
jgi:hypothetical protein